LARPVLSDKERAARRALLLQAARQLFQVSRELPSVAEIAETAGVSKGSVYLFFASKEEMFVALLEDSFTSLLTTLYPGLVRLPSDRQAAVERFCAIYMDALVDNPDLLPLAAAANAVLEKNLPVPAMLAFKERLASGLSGAAAALSDAPLGLGSQEAIDLLLRTWAITLGLWQTLYVPEELSVHLAHAPLNLFKRDFLLDLRQSLLIFWSGSLG